MSDANGICKSAMTNAEKSKYFRYALLAALSTAGVAAVARDIKSKRTRAKKLDARKSKNAIVVPIKISDFMKDLPSPEEVAKSNAAPAAALAAVGTDNDVSGMSSDDISKIKRSILSGRRMDFFSSKAAESNGGEKDGGKEAKRSDKPKGDASSNDEGSEADKGDDGGRTLLRDQSGRFVSPTDPVGVEQGEKSAGFLDDAWNAAKDRPLAVSLGIAGSYVLATAISDAIRRIRKEKSEAALDAARSRYVGLMGEGTEKKANIGSLLGEVGGHALLVPAVLAAIVTNKIISNRKKDKLVQKDRNNSIPDDPLIFYETKEGEARQIEPETALMMIMVKQAMIEDVERAYAERGELEKKAQAYVYPETQVKPAVDYYLKTMLDPKNKGKLLSLIKGFRGSGTPDIESGIKSMFPLGGIFIPGPYKSIAKTPEFREALLGDPRIGNYLVDTFNSDKDWQAYRDQETAKGLEEWAQKGNWLAKTFGGENGFDRTGIMYQIMLWLAKTFGMGMGRESFNQELSGKLGDMRNAASNQVAYRNRINEAQKLYDSGDYRYVDAYEAAKNDQKIDPEAFKSLRQPTEKMVIDNNLVSEAVGRGGDMPPLELAPERVRKDIAEAAAEREKAEEEAAAKARAESDAKSDELSRAGSKYMDSAARDSAYERMKGQEALRWPSAPTPTAPVAAPAKPSAPTPAAPVAAPAKPSAPTPAAPAAAASRPVATAPSTYGGYSDDHLKAEIPQDYRDNPESLLGRGWREWASSQIRNRDEAQRAADAGDATEAWLKGNLGGTGPQDWVGPEGKHVGPESGNAAAQGSPASAPSSGAEKSAPFKFPRIRLPRIPNPVRTRIV